MNVQKDLPILVKVDPKGFELKLAAFLSGAHPDPIFIVPAANVTDEIADTIEAAGGRLLSINQVRNHLKSRRGPKIVLKLLSNELPVLLDLLFEKKASCGNRFRWVIFGVLVLVMACAAWWGMNRPVRPSPGEIEKLLASGDFSEARRIISIYGKQSPGLETISQIMDAPLVIDLRFIVQQAADNVPAEHAVGDGVQLSLSHKDDYRFQIQADNPPQALFMYFFQIDDTGSLDQIFPNLNWRLENPIEAATWPIHIPPERDAWIFLEPLPEGETGAIRETILVVVSPWRAVDIEALYERILAEADRNHRRNLVKALAEKVRDRGRVGIPSIFFKEWSFEHVH